MKQQNNGEMIPSYQFTEHLTNVQSSHGAVRFPNHMSDTFIHQSL